MLPRGANKDVGFLGGSYPHDAVFLGGVGLTPEAEEGQTPRGARLEGKEATTVSAPLESHFFTTNFMNKKKKHNEKYKNVEIPIFSSFLHIFRKF